MKRPIFFRVMKKKMAYDADVMTMYVMSIERAIKEMMSGVQKLTRQIRELNHKLDKLLEAAP